MTDLLARFAECAFWMGRHMERAENLARIIDVNESFARDSHRPTEWLPIVEINADATRFFEKHDQASAQAVVDFYVRDVDNPTSIIASVRGMRATTRACCAT